MPPLARSRPCRAKVESALRAPDSGPDLLRCSSCAVYMIRSLVNGDVRSARHGSHENGGQLEAVALAKGPRSPFKCLKGNDRRLAVRSLLWQTSLAAFARKCTYMWSLDRDRHALTLRACRKIHASTGLKCWAHNSICGYWCFAIYFRTTSEQASWHGAVEWTPHAECEQRKPSLERIGDTLCSMERSMPWRCFEPAHLGP